MALAVTPRRAAHALAAFPIPLLLLAARDDELFAPAGFHAVAPGQMTLVALSCLMPATPMIAAFIAG